MSALLLLIQPMVAISVCAQSASAQAASVPSTSVQSANSLGDMKTIRQAYKDKHYAIAEQLLRDYLNSSPKDAEALYLLGNVLVLENRKSEAAEPYRRAVTYGAGSGSGKYAEAALASLRRADSDQPPQAAKSEAGLRVEATPRLDRVRSINAADQERKQFLEKELSEEIGWRRKDMNRKITEAQFECEDAIKSLPAIPCVAARSEIIQAARNEEINSIKKRAEEKIAGLKADFELKESELSELYQKRIAAIDTDARLHSGQPKVGGSAVAQGSAQTGASAAAQGAAPSGTQFGAQGSGNYVKNFVNYGQGAEAPTVPSQPAASAVAARLSTKTARLSTRAAKLSTATTKAVPKQVSKQVSK